MRTPDVVAAAACLLALVVGAAAPRAEADRRALPANETWKTECSACHVPYPPRLLPPRSWRAVMTGLDRHFGTDASVDPGAAAEIAAFLERHAGRDRGGPPAIRITETPWFRREHDEVPAAVWGGATVKSPANCPACHPAAERGDYDDDSVRVPR
jgi:hypothetical protein